MAVRHRKIGLLAGRLAEGLLRIDLAETKLQFRNAFKFSCNEDEIAKVVLRFRKSIRKFNRLRLS